jgi:hypothetical protein
MLSASMTALAALGCRLKGAAKCAGAAGENQVRTGRRDGVQRRKYEEEQ